MNKLNKNPLFFRLVQKYQSSTDFYGFRGQFRERRMGKRSTPPPPSNSHTHSRGSKEGGSIVHPPPLSPKPHKGDVRGEGSERRGILRFRDVLNNEHFQGLQGVFGRRIQLTKNQTNFPKSTQGSKTLLSQFITNFFNIIRIYFILYKRYLECTLIQWRLSIYLSLSAQVAEGTFFMKSPSELKLTREQNLGHFV